MENSYGVESDGASTVEIVPQPASQEGLCITLHGRVASLCYWIECLPRREPPKRCSTQAGYEARSEQRHALQVWSRYLD